MDEAESNHAVMPRLLARPNLEDDTPEGENSRAEVAAIIETTKAKEFYSLGVVLGYCYRNSPIILDDGTIDQWKSSNDYRPCAIPGCIAPHRWLDEKTSLYDRFGSGFTLLVMAAGHEADIAAAVQEAEATGTPITVAEISNKNLKALYEQPLALIRPDQHVAWRGSAWPENQLLSMVTGQIDQMTPADTLSCAL